MASLEELLQIEGVVAAVEWDTDGSLIDYKASMDISRGLTNGGSRSATVTTTFDKLSEAFSQMSGMNWTPQHSWAYSGGDWSIAVGDGGRKAVFVESTKADFNNLFGQLVGER